MYRGGAAAQIASEMKRYHLDVLGISECRWTGAGRTRYIIPTQERPQSNMGICRWKSKESDRPPPDQRQVEIICPGHAGTERS
ncbi:hypothetical protein HAZT_HAZT004941 [Hyalella azteca]|uniref:Endonuclease/exonuclease/phosphatase domain-containing protein n=1 Tax=Hyalella azteca TaxID=294128 RepID=A0A6A0HC69_HYAAZ|nr:hypothetical protein HAZT_HAZT004941 [Hyalella azteca]